MRDDPHQIADWLVHEHGLEQARAEVLAGLMQAQRDADNYALSVWREVKHLLDKRRERENGRAA